MINSKKTAWGKSKLVKALLSLVFIVLFVLYYINNPEAVTELRNYSVATILLGAILTFVSITVNGLFLKLVIDKLAKNISIAESVYTSLISTLANYVLPFRGGMGVRAVYLKHRFDFKYKDFIATLYGNYIVVFMANSGVALVALMLFFIRDGVFSPSLILVMTGILIFSISLASPRIRLDSLVLNLLDKTRLPIARKISLKVGRVLQGWKIIVQDRNLLYKIIVLAIINVSTRISLFYLLFQALGLQLSFPQIILFTVISNLSIFIAVTPGALGVRETLLLVYSNFLMVTNQHILNVSLGERAIMLSTMTLAVFVAQGYILLRRGKSRAN